MVDQEILVAGGAGYIGSHVCKMLMARGFRVVLLDDLSMGHRAAVRGTFYEGKISDTALLKTIFQKHRIKTVMHFAAKASVGESVANPLLYYAANFGETAALLTTMVECGVKHLVFSSTCSTFGEPDTVPIHERVPQNPINPYGRSKLMVEQMLADLAHSHGFNSVILRYFNAAGADPEGDLGEDHTPETHLIPLALKAAFGLGKPLTVYGKDYPTRDGSCIRDYIHVNDLADAHIRAMEYAHAHSGYHDFNLGTEQGISVFEILAAIERVTKKKVPHSVGDRRPGDPPILFADATKAKRELGWKTEYTLDQMIETAARWHEKHPNGFA